MVKVGRNGIFFYEGFYKCGLAVRIIGFMGSVGLERNFLSFTVFLEGSVWRSN